jgi:pimeloyl-ACP methyl ester carboxylesterase
MKKNLISKNIKIQEHQIHYSQNKEEGKTIVFLHGNSLSSQSFIKQNQDILAEDYRLIFMDMIGHGFSEKAQNPDKHYTYAYFVEIVAEFLKALAIENYVLVGHSMGGHIIMEGLKIWKNLKGFVLFGAPPVKQPLNITEAFQANENMGLLFKTDLTAEEKQTIIQEIYLSKNTEDSKELLEQFSQTDVEFRPFLGKNLALNNEVEIMLSNEIPVAIFQGELDKIIAKNYIDTLNLPNLWKNKVQYIEKAGHTPQWENSRLFNELLFSFVKEIM